MCSFKIETKLGFHAVEPEYIFQSSKSDQDKRANEVKGLCKIIILNLDTGTVKGYFTELGGLNRAWTIARDCYVLSMMESSIAFSSIAVELAINMDERMQHKRVKKKKKDGRISSGWLMLSNRMLRDAEEKNLPINLLLDKGETLETDFPFVKFVERRNDVSHGDYSRYSRRMAGGIIFYLLDTNQQIADIPSKEALDQLKKCSDFLNAWVNQNPKLIHHNIQIKSS